MQSETLAQEFARLVKEYHEGDDHTKPEAWNLLADYAVDNAAAISAALSDQERAVEVKPCGWVVTRKSGGGIFMSAERYDEASAAAEADIHDRGYYPVYRSALVDVPVEPVAWLHPTANWSNTSWDKIRRHCFDDDPMPVPLYPHPPHREGEDSAEVYRHKKRGSVYTVVARGRLQVDGDLDNEKVVIYRGEDGQTWVRPEYEFNDGRFEALAATRSGSATAQKGIPE